MREMQTNAIHLPFALVRSEEPFQKEIVRGWHALAARMSSYTCLPIKDLSSPTLAPVMEAT